MGKVRQFRSRRKPANEYQTRKLGSHYAGHRRGKASFSWAGVGVLALMIGLPIGAQFGPPLVGCHVKGNISSNTGERIYHVPGQEYYTQTRIDLLNGERWFCSEAAARAAGWRKSRV